VGNLVTLIYNHNHYIMFNDRTKKMQPEIDWPNRLY